MSEKIYSPWARPRNGIEFMARYQAFYGFKALGPHTKLVAQLLGDAFGPCETCDGTGLFGTYGGMGWRACPVCRGFGQVWNISPEELQRRRRKVLEAFPDAEAGGQQREPIPAPVLNLKTGEIVSAAPPHQREPVQGDLPFPDLEDAAALARRQAACRPPPAETEAKPARRPRTWAGMWTLLKRLCGSRQG